MLLLLHCQRLLSDTWLLVQRLKELSRWSFGGGTAAPCRTACDVFMRANSGCFGLLLLTSLACINAWDSPACKRRTAGSRPVVISLRKALAAGIFAQIVDLHAGAACKRPVSNLFFRREGLCDESTIATAYLQSRPCAITLPSEQLSGSNRQPAAAQHELRRAPWQPLETWSQCRRRPTPTASVQQAQPSRL